AGRAGRAAAPGGAVGQPAAPAPGPGPPRGPPEEGPRQPRRHAVARPLEDEQHHQRAVQAVQEHVEVYLNVLLHGLNGALMVLLVFKWTRDRMTAWLAGALFGGTPGWTRAGSGGGGLADRPARRGRAPRAAR